MTSALVQKLTGVRDLKKILETTVKEVGESYSAECCQIMLSSPLDPNVTAICEYRASEDQVCEIPGVVVPLSLQGKAMGQLSIARSQAVTADEVAVIRATLSEMGDIIRHAQINDIVQRETFRNTFLVEIGNVMAYSLGIGDALFMVVNILGKVLQSSRCVFICTDDSQAGWKCYEFWQQDKVQSCQEYCWPTTDSPIVAQTLLASAPIIVHEGQQNSYVSPVQEELQFIGVKSFLGVPLRTEESTYGCVIVQQCDYRRAWTRNEIDMVQNVSDKVAEALAKLPAEKRNREPIMQLHQRTVAAPDGEAAQNIQSVRKALKGALGQQAIPVANKTSAPAPKPVTPPPPPAAEAMPVAPPVAPVSQPLAQQDFAPPQPPPAPAEQAAKSLNTILGGVKKAAASNAMSALDFGTSTRQDIPTAPAAAAAAAAAAAVDAWGAPAADAPPAALDAWGAPAADAPPAALDAWGAPAPAAPPSAVDAWGAPAPTVPPAAADAWGAPAPTVPPAALDAWGAPAPTAPSAALDAWGAPAPTAPSAALDAWGAPAPTAPSAAPDAWGAPTPTAPSAAPDAWGAPTPTAPSAAPDAWGAPTPTAPPAAESVSEATLSAASQGQADTAGTPGDAVAPAASTWGNLDAIGAPAASAAPLSASPAASFEAGAAPTPGPWGSLDAIPAPGDGAAAGAASRYGDLDSIPTPSSGPGKPGLGGAILAKAKGPTSGSPLLASFHKDKSRFTDSAPKTEFVEGPPVQIDEVAAQAKLQEVLSSSNPTSDFIFATPGLDARMLGRIDGWVSQIEQKDKYLNGHARQVAEYATAIATQLAMTPAEIDAIRLASLVHDVGKLGAAPQVLQKADEDLSDAELLMMMKHPLDGAELLESFPDLKPLAPLVRAHHEEYDGNGYPAGLKGEEIPLAARIINVANAYHSFTSPLRFRQGMTATQAQQELTAGAGKQWDPRVVEALILSIMSQKVPATF